MPQLQSLRDFIRARFVEGVDANTMREIMTDSDRLRKMDNILSVMPLTENKFSTANGLGLARVSTLPATRAEQILYGVIAKVLDKHVFAINREEYQLGYAQRAGIFGDSHGNYANLFLMGEADADKDPTLIEKGWRRATERLIELSDADWDMYQMAQVLR